MAKSIERDIIEATEVLHFYKHPLGTRPVFIEDDARPHRSRAVNEYLRGEEMTILPLWSFFFKFKLYNTFFGSYNLFLFKAIVWLFLYIYDQCTSLKL